MKTFTSVLLLATAAIVVNTADAALPSFRGFAISGTLYGTAPNVSLETVDPSTGEQHAVGPGTSYEAQAQELSALDEKRNIYYIVGFNASTRAVNLVGFDTNSGKVEYDIKLPFYEGPFVGLGQQIAVEPDSGKVIVGGRLEKKGPHEIGFLNLQTGKFEKVTTINETDLPVLDGVSAYDPSSGKFVTMFGIRNQGVVLFAVDMKTGKVEKIKEDPEEGREISTLDYDPKTKTLVGLGIQPNSTGGITRTLVSLDVSSHKWTTIGQIDNFVVADGSISALNVHDRSLYWIGQKDGEKKNGTFYLIDVNVDNANVKDSVKLCDQAHCPWTLEYQNGNSQYL